MGLVKLTVLDLRNKVQDQVLAWLSLLSFLSFSLLFCDFFCDFSLGHCFFHGQGGGGRGLSLFQVHLLFFLAPELSLLRVQCFIPFGHYNGGFPFGSSLTPSKTGPPVSTYFVSQSPHVDAYLYLDST